MEFERIRKILVIALVLALAFSVLLNLHTQNLLTVQQKRTDYMCAEAFKHWLEEMKSVKSILEVAETNLDVVPAMNYTAAALGFANVLAWTIEIERPANFGEHLYLQIAGATIRIWEFESDRAWEANHIGVQNLTDGTLQWILNKTQTIQSLIDTVGQVEYDIDPVKQLEERGTLTQVTDYAHLLSGS